jgi:O-antigen ligase/polysaccharide polymerase Wzy-like membrane protein
MYETIKQPIATVPVAPPRREAARRVPFMVALLVIGAFIPEAFGFFIAGFRIVPVRVPLLLAVPVLLFGIRIRSGPRAHRRPISDLLVPLVGVWLMLAFVHDNGVAIALKSGTMEILAFVIPYTVMRYMLRDEGQVHAAVRLFCIVAAISGLLGLLDTFTGKAVLREPLARLTGYNFFTADSRPAEGGYRLGLLRASGPLDGPELFGTAMCYGLFLCGDLKGRVRWFCRCGTGIGLFISLSSGPWMATIVGLGILLYRRIVVFHGRWLALIVAAVAALVIFVMVKSDPFSSIVYHLTLDPQTGYFRLLIWQYAGADALQSPIFGLGFPADWPRPEGMPSSIDSLWLELALRYGIPASVLTFLALISSSSRSSWGAGRISARGRKLAETLGIITFLTVFNGFTVDYFGTSIIIVSFLTGMRAFLGQLG